MILCACNLFFFSIYNSLHLFLCGIICCKLKLILLFAEGEYIQLADGILERNGVGTHTSSDGTTYQGQWMNDKMHGVGRIQFPGGASYEGNFKENKFHGSGHYTWPNGSLFDGSFVDNKLVISLLKVY